MCEKWTSNGESPSIDYEGLDSVLPPETAAKYLMRIATDPYVRDTPLDMLVGKRNEGAHAALNLLLQQTISEQSAQATNGEYIVHNEMLDTA